MLKKLIFSLLSALLACIFVMQYDPRVQERCATLVCNYIRNEPDCSVSCIPKSVNFFSPELILEDVVVFAGSKSWLWKAQRMVFSFSWWHFIKNGRIDLDIALYGYKAFSQTNASEPAITPHIRCFFAGSISEGILIGVKTLEINDGSVQIVDSAKQNSVTCFFTSALKFFAGDIKAAITILDGDCVVHGRHCVTNVNGTLLGTCALSAGYLRPYITTRISMELPQLTSPSCIFSGSYHGDEGVFHIKQVNEQLLAIDASMHTNDKSETVINGAGKCPLSYVCNVVTNDVALQGACAMTGTMTVGEKLFYKTNIVLSDIVYGTRNIGTNLTVDVEKTDRSIHGLVTIPVGEESALIASYHGYFDNFSISRADFSLYNKGNIRLLGLPYWSIGDGNGEFQIKWNNHGLYYGMHRCLMRNVINNTSIDMRGVLRGDDDECTLYGVINDGVYTMTGPLTRMPFLNEFRYLSKDGSHMIKARAEESNKWSGSVSFDSLGWFVDNVSGIALQGQGDILFDGTYDDHTLYVNAFFNDGAIRLPYTYNFINTIELNLRADVPGRVLYVDTARCGVHTEEIRCQSGSVHYAHDYTSWYVHMPLLLHRCPLNIKKNVNAVLSGYWLLSKKRGADFFLDGNFIIERAHIKDSLIGWHAASRSVLKDSGVAFKSWYNAMQLNMTVETKDYMRVEMPLLHTNVKGHLAISNTVTRPHVHGEVICDSGSLLFPYKPLHIVKGSMRFEGDDPSNPMVELLARNRVKKHVVTLYAQGLLGDYQVMLDTNPPLSEDQIISLLLAGSYENTLNVMAPALMMHNLKMALFGSGPASFLDSYFKRVAMPFSINLVPSFTDQTGRGGLRGGIEITVNDRWRAYIQKNFSLSEDTRFELEYLFSDDIGIRVVRDEHRDISGEIEMRWKF